jgi:hypothetical protein
MMLPVSTGRRSRSFRLRQPPTARIPWWPRCNGRLRCEESTRGFFAGQVRRSTHTHPNCGHRRHEDPDHGRHVYERCERSKSCGCARSCRRACSGCSACRARGRPPRRTIPRRSRTSGEDSERFRSPSTLAASRRDRPGETLARFSGTVVTEGAALDGAKLDVAAERDGDEDPVCDYWGLEIE